MRSDARAEVTAAVAAATAATFFSLSASLIGVPVSTGFEISYRLGVAGASCLPLSTEFFPLRPFELFVVFAFSVIVSSLPSSVSCSFLRLLFFLDNVDVRDTIASGTSGASF